MDVDKAKNNLKKHIETIKEYGCDTTNHPKECNYCANTLLKDLKYPMEKVNKMFMADFLHLKYNRPEELLLEQDEEA